MSATALLDRLELAKQTSRSRWLARCPAHNDRSPSLSIREVDDGKVLIKCWAGCGALDVLTAIGLEWSALFPSSSQMRGSRPSHSRIPARDLLEIIDREALVAVMIVNDITASKTASETDWRRLAQCSARIGKARDYVHGKAP